jgi:PAS domain S-box-containing protein
VERNTTKPDRFQLFADSVKDYAFIQYDARNRVTDWNTGAERVLGYNEQEIIGQDGAIFFTPEDRAAKQPEMELATAVTAGRAEDERWHVRKDGSRFRASGVMTPLRDDAGQLIGFAKVMRDVTERERARERLERANHEKDSLLREIHHRVKNNLQVIVSLLSMHARHVADPHAAELIIETQNRVRAIARIHESLYGSSDLSMVRFGSYLNRLASDLVSFYGMRDRVATHVQAEEITLEIERAIPLALITNELLCNALKHGFPEGRTGVISVALTQNGADARLCVFDDGIGLPKSVNLDTATSMGFHLIRILSAQLQAHAEMSSNAGTRIALQFAINPE